MGDHPSSICNRSDTGRYIRDLHSKRVLTVLQDAEDPVLTAGEVGDQLDCSSEAARQYLHELRERGDVKSKNVGARAVVWWADGNS